MSKTEYLTVFKEAHRLVLEVYTITNKFPTFEQFGIVSQIRRAVISIPANIAEGNARGHNKEFVQFLYVSTGSLEEVKYFLLLSRDLGYLTQVQYQKLRLQAESVGRLLAGLIKYRRKLL